MLYTARMSPALNRSSEIQRYDRRDTIEIRDGIMFLPGTATRIALTPSLCHLPLHPPPLSQIIQRNEVMLQESRNTITVPSTFVLRILAYLNRRRRCKAIQTVNCVESIVDYVTGLMYPPFGLEPCINVDLWHNHMIAILLGIAECNLVHVS